MAKLIRKAVGTTRSPPLEVVATGRPWQSLPGRMGIQRPIFWSYPNVAKCFC